MLLDYLVFEIVSHYTGLHPHHVFFFTAFVHFIRSLLSSQHHSKPFGALLPLGSFCLAAGWPPSISGFFRHSALFGCCCRSTFLQKQSFVCASSRADVSFVELECFDLSVNAVAYLLFIFSFFFAVLPLCLRSTIFVGPPAIL